MSSMDRRSAARLRSAASRAETLAAQARAIGDQRSDDAESDDTADRLRAEDDVRTARQQESLARDEHVVAQQLGENADALRKTAADLQATREQMARARGDAERLAAELEKGRERMRRTKARIRRAGPAPDRDADAR